MRRTTRLIAAAATTALAAGLLVPTANAAPSPRKPAKVGITLSTTTPVVELGKKVSLKGRVTPKKGVKGLRLVIQQKTGTKGWKKAGTTTVKKSGKFTFTEKPTTATRRSYRAMVVNNKHFKKAKSPKVAVAVASWRDARKVTEGPLSGITWDPTIRVGGVKYSDALVSTEWEFGPAPMYKEFNLIRQCFKVKTSVALTDNSATGATTTARIYSDSVLKSTTELNTLGAVVPVTVDVTNAFRVRFEVPSRPLETSPEHLVAFLDPRILCTS